MPNIKLIDNFERCPLCNKILFRKKGGGMRCINGCQQNFQGIAFNTLVEPTKNRRRSGKMDPRRQVWQ